MIVDEGMSRRVLHRGDVPVFLTGKFPETSPEVASGIRRGGTRDFGGLRGGTAVARPAQGETQ